PPDARGTPRCTGLRPSLGILRFPRARFRQQWAARVSFAEFFLASAQSRAQLVFQVVKVHKLRADVHKLLFQSPSHRRAWLQPPAPQFQKLSNFLERKSQALDSPDEFQRFHVTVRVLTESTSAPRRARQQGVALIETNRIGSEANLPCNVADVHRHVSYLRNLHPGV